MKTCDPTTRCFQKVSSYLGVSSYKSLTIFGLSTSVSPVSVCLVKRLEGKIKLEDAMERYFTEVKPNDLATLESVKYADFLAQNHMSQGQQHCLKLQHLMTKSNSIASDSAFLHQLSGKAYDISTASSNYPWA
ncbi:unnamed protein product [Toxocara canis]|uniref:SERPIN domain-containing protein n=1 Tax=Toxocara canis TaxID=6265 RepID=A0A183UB61_TOXCA|nr:unnamed protein product [Toxocara canis]